MSNNHIIYLEVPFDEKEQAKQLGARWNADKRKWYITQSLISAQEHTFQRWLPQQRTSAPSIHKPQKTPSPSSVELPLEHQHNKLSELLKEVEQAINKHFSVARWIVCDILSIKKYSSGHCYIEVAEYDHTRNVQAKANAVIWSKNIEILHKFQQHTNQELAQNQSVLVAVSVNYHSVYGLKLIIHDIDPSYTLGAMEQKLQQIRAQLKKEQLFRRQKQLKLPEDYYHIAVISPQDASSLHDFRRVADGLHHLCQFEYFSAFFGGNQARSTLEKAMSQVIKRNESVHFDCLIIIRGGGAKGDLYELNDYHMARIICTAPFPILTGIGHENDRTILDEVAFAAFSTPTKTAQFIRQSIIDAAQKAQQNLQTIRLYTTSQLHSARDKSKTLHFKLHRALTEYTQHARLSLPKPEQLQNLALQRIHQQRRYLLEYGNILSNCHALLHQAHQLLESQLYLLKNHLTQRLTAHSARLEKQHINVHNLSRTVIKLQQHKLTQQHQSSIKAAVAQTQKQHQKLQHFKQFIEQAQPENILRQGFSIVRQNKQIITRAKHLDAQQAISIQFHDDQITR